MTPVQFVALALAGGLGAVGRFVVDGMLGGRMHSRLPVGTVVINLSGSLALGFVVGLASAHLVSPAARAIVGTGFLGGYTTLGTASVEVARLVAARAAVPALVTALAVPVAATALAALGLIVGTAR